MIISNWRSDLEWVPYEAQVLVRHDSYYDAIRSARENEDTSPFVRYMLEAGRDATIGIVNREDPMMMYRVETVVMDDVN